MKKFLVYLLLGTSVLTINPDGFSSGSIDSNGSFVILTPKGVESGWIDRDGTILSTGEKGITYGFIEPDTSSTHTSPWESSHPTFSGE